MGVGVQLLQKLADYGLLAEGLPPGCEADNTRFFTTESVMAAKEWLESVETIEDVAKKERTTPHQIYIRFVQSGFVRALSIAGRTLLSGIDVVRIREHRKR